MKSAWVFAALAMAAGVLALGALAAPQTVLDPMGTPLGGVPPRIATTTTSISVRSEASYDEMGNVVEIRPMGSASLVANADVNGDDVNDVIMVTVDPPPAPPTAGELRARYRLFVTDGATGLTIHNLHLSSPIWW